jgi:hypothetical protein
MTDITGSVREIETASRPAIGFAGNTFPDRTLKAKIADLWPAAVIAFGVLLTIAWTGGLSWLLLSLLLLVV